MSAAVPLSFLVTIHVLNDVQRSETLMLVYEEACKLCTSYLVIDLLKACFAAM